MGTMSKAPRKAVRNYFGCFCYIEELICDRSYDSKTDRFPIRNVIQQKLSPIFINGWKGWTTTTFLSGGWPCALEQHQQRGGDVGHPWKPGGRGWDQSELATVRFRAKVWCNVEQGWAKRFSFRELGHFIRGRAGGTISSTLLKRVS